jgi:hypothetical protein
VYSCLFMKIFNLKFLAILLMTVLFSSCVSTALYIGETMPATTKVDVYYAAKDVKREYTVTGHISVPQGVEEETDAKLQIIEKAKSVGADGVIVLGLDFTGGKESTPFYKAEAIKYVN